MKKVLCYMLVIVLSLCSVSLIACGDKTPTTETVTVYGEFYTLQEAYDKNWLTDNECKLIADNENTSENQPELGTVVTEKILHDYKELHPISSDDIKIKCYGSFNDCYVISITDMYYGNAFLETVNESRSGSYYVYDNKRRKTVSTHSVDFYWVRVWKENDNCIRVDKQQKPFGAFLTYERAYGAGLFSKQDWLNRDYKENTVNDIAKMQHDWEKTKNKIIDDYFDLGIDNDLNKKIGIYDPTTGRFPNTESYIPEVYLVGTLNGNFVVKVSTLYNGDPLQDEYELEFIDGISYKDHYPFCIMWVPVENITHALNSERLSR